MGAEAWCGEDAYQPASERRGNNVKGSKNFHLKNDSSQGQNLVLTVLCMPSYMPSSLDSSCGGRRGRKGFDAHQAWGFRRGRCRANPAHIRQSGPDSALGFRAKVIKALLSVPILLGRGRNGLREWWRSLSSGTLYTLHHTPHTLHPTPCTMHLTPYTPHPSPYTLHTTH